MIWTDGKGNFVLDNGNIWITDFMDGKLIHRGMIGDLGYKTLEEATEGFHKMKVWDIAKFYLRERENDIKR